ncbi:hypothetical protein ACVWYQ_003263 [Bradyrhizobium sp. USDA 3397]
MALTQTKHWYLPPKTICYAILFFVSVGTVSLRTELAAAGDQPPTDAEKDACIQDVFRLCSNHIPDATAITACLRAKQASLSHQCRYVISARDTARAKPDLK